MNESTHCVYETTFIALSNCHNFYVNFCIISTDLALENLRQVGTGLEILT